MFKRGKKGSLLAIDIGSHAVKIVEGQWTNNQLKIQSTAEEALPDEAVINGNLKDPGAVENAISKAIAKSGARTKDAVVTIETSDMIKREIIIPKVPETDQKGLIGYEIEQYLPINTESYVLQHRLMEEVKSEEGKLQDKMLVGALPAEVAKGYHDLLIGLHLDAVALDTHTNALEKLFEQSKEINGHINLKNTTIALVDIGHKMINITLFEKSKYQFNRLIQYGCDGLRDIMKNDPDRSDNVPAYEEVDIHYLTGQAATEDTMIEHSVRDYMVHMAEDINKILRYYTSRSLDNKIEHVLLMGGGSKIKGLDAFFTDQLEYPSETILKLDVLPTEYNNDVDKIPLYLNAYGALIRR